MSKLLSLFDYVYYRLYLFFKGKGDTIPDFSAMLVLTIIECLTLLNIVVLVRIFYPFPLLDKIFIVPIIGLIGVINWLRYQRNFSIRKLVDKWKYEEYKRKLRNGWFIGLYLLTSFLIPAIHGYLEHNLGLL